MSLDHTDSLKVLTWNLENLNEIEGEELFAGRSKARTERDWAAMRKYLVAADADIILFQEAGSPRAIKRILPLKYEFYFSPLYQQRSNPSSRIFTAIAYKVERIPTVQTFSIATHLSPPTDTSSEVNLRDSVGVSFYHDKVRINLISVHLKSSCRNKSTPLDLGDKSACAILFNQLKLLSEEMPKPSASNELTIVGGDFNRRGNPTYETDHYLSLLRAEGLMRKIAKPDVRQCPSYLGQDKRPIDFFYVFSTKVWYELDAQELVFNSIDVERGYKLSDHCPVSLLIRIHR